MMTLPPQMLVEARLSGHALADPAAEARVRLEALLSGEAWNGRRVAVCVRAGVSSASGREENREPVNGEEARARLFKKLGPDWLVKRFVDQKFEALGADDEKKVKGLVEKLASDDVADRDAGFEDLRKFGARAAPLLMPLLKSGDEEVKTRVRQLLSEWAEPK